MNSTETLPVPPTSPALTPVVERERLVVLDVLRGVALLGVVIANVWLWFSGLAFRFPEYRQELLRLSLDSAVFHSIAVFVSGKAISTFSFLFGLGFAVQMLRAESRGRSVVPVYARRLTVLLLIGLAHMVLLWYGDILAAYAVLGFVLLLFRKRRDRTLLVWAAILLGAVPLLLAGLPLVLGAIGMPLPVPDVEEIARRNAATLAVFQGGNYAAILGENLHQAGKFYLGRKAPWLLFVLGLFLVGLYAGRRRVFENVAAYRPMFRRIALWGVSIGLTASIASSVFSAAIEPTVMLGSARLMFSAMVLSMVGTVPLAAGYVCAATLCLQHPRFARWLGPFAPVGRMALTNYLAQTIVMLLIFYPYGSGLIGRTGPAFGLLVALAVFALQMVWSRHWLARFHFGPMEWVWRSLTYGARQPMRIGRLAERAGAVKGAGV